MAEGSAGLMSYEDPASGNTEIGAVVSAASTAEVLQSYCEQNGLPNPWVQVSATPIQMLKQLPETVKVLVIQSDEAVSEELLDRLCQLIKVAPDVAPVVILEPLSQAEMRRLFRAGVADVLCSPVSKEDLHIALAEARNVRASTAPRTTTQAGKIISVIKSAGGVGATQIAINLAREMKDQTNRSVALVDLDIQFGSIGLMMDLEPRMNVNDAVRAAGRLDTALLGSLMTKHSCGVDVLAAADTIAPIDAVDEKALGKICDQLRSDYELTILELPSAWSAWMHAALVRSEAILVVTDCSVRGAAGVSRLAQGLVDLELSEAPLFLVMNKCQVSSEHDGRSTKIRKILATPHTAKIGLNRKLAELAADRGQCVKDINSKSDLAGDFAALGGRLATVLGLTTTSAESDVSNNSIKSRLLGKLKSIGEQSK